ncbi:MAG TPA: hypothetical protein DCX95_07165 [Elusimicrobia bacterium]|nr:hypothetical protein [Elusimicrobiota bacterium]
MTDNINILISDSKKRIGFFYIVKNFAKIFIVVFLSLFLNFFADIFSISSFTYRVLLWLTTAGFILFLAIKTFLRINRLKNADGQFAILLQKKNPALKDDLINAVQLKGDSGIETSQELAEKFVKQTSEKISPDLSKTVISFNSVKSVFIIFFVLFVNVALFYDSFQFNRYLLPFKRDIKILVVPGDIAITAGSNVNIYATIKTEKSTPFLFFKEKNSDWHKSKMKQISDDKYSGIIEKITDDTEYYVELLDSRSQRYKIKIVAPLTIADIQIEYFYPQNIGLQNKIVNESDIESPIGTTVKISARVNKKIKEAFLLTDTAEKIKMEIPDGEKDILTSLLVIQNQKEDWIEAESVDGDSYQPIKHKIGIIKNNPPTVEIISPAFDVMISENGILKIVYSAEDDFGIKEIEINYLTLKKKNLLKSFSKPETKIIDDYEISVSELGLKPGDIVQYQLVVADNNMLIGNSKIYTIEILSYEMEHKIIENALSDFNNELREILSRQLQSNTLLSKQDFENALKMQKNTKELTSAGIDNFQKILEKMKDDPLTTYQIYNEYKNLSETLSALEKQKMLDAINSISDKQYEQAKQKQEEITDELERLSGISENILKNQKMEDMLSTVREMSDTSANIEENLNNMKAMPNAEKMKELQKAMAQLSELTGKLAEKISQLPKETPDEFANDENVKKIDLAEMRLTADEMKWTLEVGNIDKAIELAQKLSRQISDMLNSVENAAQSVSGGKNAELEEKLNRSLSELNEIIESQKNIITDTQKTDAKRLEKILALQKELIEKLAELQKQAISELQNSKMLLEKSTATPVNIYNLYVSPEIKMNIVLREFITEKIDKSRQLLTEIINELDILHKNINIKKSAEHVLKSRATEQKILSELTNFSPEKTAIFNKEDFEGHKKLSETQKLNRQKTGELKQKLSKLADRTASIPSDAVGNISSSEKSMESGAGELSNSNIPSSLDFEKKALDDLLNGKDAMEKASSQMKQMPGAGGTMGTSGQIRMRGNGAGGHTGFRTGFVKIPSKDDYKPPKEFREEIIKSLRQKYPQKYETIIKDYFKRLIE